MLVAISLWKITITLCKKTITQGDGQIKRKNILLFTLLTLSIAITITPGFAIDQELKNGDTGEDIKTLQTWLYNQGFYSGEIDGNFSNYTEMAVKNFQTYMGLKEDGIVGNITIDAMSQFNTPTQSQSQSGTRQHTQRTTNNKRYYNGWGNGKGTGDCWDNSNNLYNQLTSNGQQARIVQYRNSYVSNHRSVQTYTNGAWVDYDYRGNGYSNRYNAQSSKPGMTVIK